MSIDERHHRSRTQATSPAIKPPRLGQETRPSAAPPEFRQESYEEYPYPPCQDIFCHGSQGQGQVKPSPRTRWVGDRSSEPRSREWRWLWTSVFVWTSAFARAWRFPASRPRDLRAVQDKAATCRGKGAPGVRGIRPPRRPPCCPRCLLRARAAVRTVQERRAHEFRPSDYEKGTRHLLIYPIGRGEYLRSDRWRR